MIIWNWKGVQQYTGKSIRAIKEKHYRVERLPLIKSYPSQQGRIGVVATQLDLWMNRVGWMPRNYTINSTNTHFELSK